MIKYLKSQIKNLPFIIVVFVLLYGIATLATNSNFTFESSDVKFDNTGTEIIAGDVQSAINEVFQHATDYNEIKTTIGTGTLTTTNQTLIGGINELSDKVANIKYEQIMSARTLTDTYVDETLETGKKLSDYDFIYIVPGKGNWVSSSVFINRSLFISVTGVSNRIMTGSSNAIIEVCVKYKTDTSVSVKYNADTTYTDVAVRIYGIKLG